VAGWRLPRVAIIDVLGLNDYVIARNPPRLDRDRAMAHERVPPVGYLASFPVNYAWRDEAGYGYFELDTELSAAEIVATETYWIGKVVQGKSPVIPPITEMRQGEFAARQEEYERAIPLLRSALSRDPDLCGARSLLAACYMNANQPDSAWRIVRESDSASNCSALSLTRLGLIGRQLGREPGTGAARTATYARSLLEKAIMADSTRIDAMVALAGLALEAQRIDLTGDYLARLETLPDIPPGSLLQLVADLAHHKQRDLARRTLDLAIAHGLDRTIVSQWQAQYPLLR
jgi:tetratricopeptide (TPR) repeat protein